MIQVNENRTLTKNDVVECYRNLHKNAFSIRNKKSKLVVAIGNGFILENVICKVSEKGRQRVINEKRKNVHSVLIGEYIGQATINTSTLDELYYNPYTLNSFINKRTSEPVTNVEKVYFYNNKCYIID